MAVVFGCPLVGTYAELANKVLKPGQRAYATDGDKWWGKIPEGQSLTKWKTGTGEKDKQGILKTFKDLPWDTNMGGDSEAPDLSNYYTKEEVDGKLGNIETDLEIERLQYYGDKDIVPSDGNLFFFIPIDDKTASISLKRNRHTELVIPYKYIDDDEKEYKIINIEDEAFYNCNNLITVTIPNSVTRIGEDAFNNCNNLTSVIIPNSVTSIGKYAFSYCRSLANVTIPNSITQIRDGTFYNCNNLTSVIIPNSVISIGIWAFRHCNNLISIKIPNSVMSIGDNAFERCSEDLTIICNPGSYAETYAKRNGIKYAYDYIDPTTIGSSGDNDLIVTADAISEDEILLRLENISVGYDEIISAFNEGKNVWLQATDSGIHLKAPMVGIEQDYAVFCCSIDRTIVTARIYINADDILDGHVAVQICEAESNRVEIIDNLESADTDKALSANQGKILNEIKEDISKKLDDIHNWDSTEANGEYPSAIAVIEYVGARVTHLLNLDEAKQELINGLYDNLDNLSNKYDALQAEVGNINIALESILTIQDSILEVSE